MTETNTATQIKGLSADVIIPGHVDSIVSQIYKPWYESKKIWLTAIAFGVALYLALSGKHTGLTPEDVIDKIVMIASMVGPIVVLVSKIAIHDTATRMAALEILKTAQTLNTPDPDDPVQEKAAIPAVVTKDGAS